MEVTRGCAGPRRGCLRSNGRVDTARAIGTHHQGHQLTLQPAGRRGETRRRRVSVEEIDGEMWRKMLAELRVEHARATSETHLLATEALSDTPPTPDPPFPDPWGPAIAAVEFVLILSLNCREPGDGNT